RNLRGFSLSCIEPRLSWRITIPRVARKDQRLMTSKKTGYFLGALAGAGVMAAAVARPGARLPQPHADQPQLIRASTAPIFAPPPGPPMSFADIFDRVSPAVVSINVTSRVEASALRIPGLPFDLTPKGA